MDGTQDTWDEEGVDLVTGACGFSGSYVARELLASGRRVRGTDTAKALADRRRAQIHADVGVDRADPRLELRAADLLDAEEIASLFADGRVRRVFHTASLYDYSAALATLRRVNVEGARTLVRASLDAGIARFVHWSTCGVFGKPYPASSGPGRNNLPFDEGSSSPKDAPPAATRPEGTELVNAYSVSKWEQEQLVWRAHRDEGLPLTVIRPAPIYGPGSDYGHGGIILAIARGLLPAIPADARNYVTTSVHVEDVARFARFIAGRDEAIGEDYNVVDDAVISYAEYLGYIALLTGRRMRRLPVIRQRWLRPAAVAVAWTWTQLERRFGVPRVRVLEVQSATYLASSYWLSNRKSLATGFGYRYADVREGLKDTIAWMRRAGWI